MATARWRRVAAVAGSAIVLAGCGSSAGRSGTNVASHAGANPIAVGVIRAWSTALRRGNIDAAARYFALPSKFVNGAGDSIVIHTEIQARAANASLPCGAVLISAARHGRFVHALFRLTDRPGPFGGCGAGTGQLARTDFIIAKGRIADWIRAPAPGPPPGPAVSVPAPGPVV